jgi:RimJ/RimL family protein N-acetyltransferase
MPYPCTADAVRAWFAERKANDGYVCAILAKPDDVFAGSIGMSPGGEIGYWVARKFWGRGYATDAVRCMIEFARRDKIPRLHAEVFPDNVASSRVLEKAGFTQIGNVVRDLPLRGGLRELLVYELGLDSDVRMAHSYPISSG